MHPRIYQEYERICSEQQIGGSALEVGALPSQASLLALKSLAGVKEKIGISLDGPFEFADFKIVKGNANSMDCFEDNRFDTVLCNATLEHDKYFWKTVAEIKRVTKPGGLIVIGIPAFVYLKPEKIKALLSRTPLIRHLRSTQFFNMFFTATMTYEIHNFPGDYYRFSPQAMREVLMEHTHDVELRRIMLPPRLIGIGRKD